MRQQFLFFGFHFFDFLSIQKSRVNKTNIAETAAIFLIKMVAAVIMVRFGFFFGSSWLTQTTFCSKLYELFRLSIRNWACSSAIFSASFDMLKSLMRVLRLDCRKRGFDVFFNSVKFCFACFSVSSIKNPHCYHLFLGAAGFSFRSI